ncbi:PREDICTED: putative late blight resistance protein homolog R1C-3 [Erythranthe guttata]|uniref:putative late blight resistance protein homolog R1C-3 n=1 Tax=Erythranthe guttata TaxID=4155 RepID=UPI00064DE179|nr:PREDICTED: putative late blight resistance protein homolog R1C-3 [Erythranthe guttata]|eukprot:XP_012854075.1 PREDICTED: putative late blight resistance protein homolog R1C-3 [Erythranthe guttata]
MVYKSLKGSRYLIVLDDVWDTELWDELISSFPIGENGGNILLTTRLEEVANNLWSSFRIRFLDKKESWDLFRQKVFGEEESFSYELERAGKKIAEKCEGLPLTIVTVADILSKAEKTAKYWSEVAAKKQSSVFVDAYDQMSKVLYPSYDYLDQHLKPCFLYFGAFPQNYPIPWYQLVDLWSAERFRDSGPNRYSDLATTFASGSYCYLLELFSKNVIMYDAKGCGYHLHSSFWFLCNKEAMKNKFFYDVNGHVDASPEEGKTYQRRLCIRNSTLFGTKDVYDSIASVSTVRSLLCTGPYHQYPVPMSLEHLTLLRVLEARIRFYEFPMEVVKLVQLRYFALVYDGNLPPSISKLLNLEYLIVDRNHSIVTSTGNSSYLPTEI